MKNLLHKLNLAIHSLRNDEGQDLVEYALVVALIAFAAVGAMSGLATSINNSFTKINVALTSNIT
jgi:pilus assembly protein Flp/PilA